jgi:WD40 repeat protein
VRASVLGLAYRPDGKHLAAVTADGYLQLLDTATGTVLHLRRPQPGLGDATIPMLAVTYSPDGKQLVTSVANALQPTTVRDMLKLDAESGQLLRTLHAHTAPVNGLAFSTDGRRLVSASWEMSRGQSGEVKLWDVASGAAVLTLPGHLLAAFSPDGRYLAGVDPAAAPNGGAIVKVWDSGVQP